MDPNWCGVNDRFKVDAVLLGFFHRVVDGWIRSYLEDTGRGKNYENDESITVQSFYEQPRVIAYCYK
jgi:hypothetical protein